MLFFCNRLLLNKDNSLFFLFNGVIGIINIVIINLNRLEHCKRLVYFILKSIGRNKSEFTMSLYLNLFTGIYIYAASACHINHLECAQPIYFHNTVAI